MLVPIKIQCECGQRYAFDAEAGCYLLPNSIVCPVCGADGTAAANAAIAQGRSAQPTVATSPTGGPVIRIATPPPPPRPTAPPTPASTARPRGAALLVGEVTRSQAEHEAKAKIFWGDPPEEVIKYLMFQGIGYGEASGLVRAMSLEREAAIRANGIRKIVIGISLMSVPALTYLIFASIGIVVIRIFAITIVVGVWGTWMLLNGTIMYFAPKVERGDVADL